MGENGYFFKKVSESGGNKMSIFETAERWLWTVAVKKLVVAIVGFLTSQAAIQAMNSLGIQIDMQKFQIELTAGLIGAFTIVHDWLKLKFPESKWL